MSSRRGNSCLSLVSYLIIAAIAISGLILGALSFHAYLGDGDSGINSRDRTIALEDNTVQLITSPGIWTTIIYHRQLHISDSWHHNIGSGIVKCLREGTYQVYFSIQLSLSSPSEPNKTYYCQSENLRHQIRATSQYDGKGALHEIRSSRTRGDRDATLIGKYFLFHSNEGDLLRFQFYSLCGDVILTTAIEPYLDDSIYANSATLAIS